MIGRGAMANLDGSMGYYYRTVRDINPHEAGVPLLQHMRKPLNGGGASTAQTERGLENGF
jgi:hypothetical protein